jgi:hypothetical protein
MRARHVAELQRSDNIVAHSVAPKAQTMGRIKKENLAPEGRNEIELK